MENAKLILEYLKVILSSHIVVSMAIIGLFLIFKEDVKALMRRIATIKLPGGGELSTSQIEKSKEEFAQNTERPPVSSEGSPQVPDNLNLTQEQVGALRQIFDAERARAALWEYRYLNFFLVRTTQKVLDWLASLPNSTTVSLFDALWMPLTPSAEERKAIIDVLQAHHLIQFQGELVEVTPKGREYIQWRGALPADIP